MQDLLIVKEISLDIVLNSTIINILIANKTYLFRERGFMNFEIDPMFSIFSLLRCANGLNKERTKFYGLNDLETIILIHIGLMKNPSQKDISKKLGAPKQTVNNIIKSLEEDGQIKLIQDENDKRIRILSLTKKGEKNRDARIKPIVESNKRIYEKLGEEKASEIRDNLKLLNATIREEFEKEDE